MSDIEKLTVYDPAEDLGSSESIEIFLNDAFETGNAVYIAKSLGLIARAKGDTQDG